MDILAGCCNFAIQDKEFQRETSQVILDRRPSPTGQAPFGFLLEFMIICQREINCSAWGPPETYESSFRTYYMGYGYLYGISTVFIIKLA